MRRILIAAACSSLVVLGVGCTTPSREQLRLDMESHNSRIEEAFERALTAEDPWERRLWEAEYARRVREAESYLETARAERTARAEYWRQLGQLIQEAGLIVLQSRLGEYLGPDIQRTGQPSGGPWH